MTNGSVTTASKRLLLGRPISTANLRHTLLAKRLALPVFCSDPLSSNAYATEEILLVLSLGGLAFLHLAPWVAAAVLLLLVIVVASYRQTCYAYPDGGGAYAVSRANLGTGASLVAASALLVDYVLTVAVSVAAGVANVASAVPSLSAHVVVLSVGCVVLLALMNLRGTRESGVVFALPTYGFVLSVFLMLGVGLVRTWAGHPPVAESSTIGLRSAEHLTGLLVLVLLLRAFASGCTALTGVEAVSNGVPSFRKPKAHNAAATLVIMGGLTVLMFAGITTLAMVSKVHVAAEPSQLVGAPAGYEQRTVIAQLAGAVFGMNSFGFYVIQACTAAILVLAANTAFNGFPILASILASDGYMPRQLARRGDRLVFSNGILILSGLAVALLVAFHASTTRLIQLYIIGVFVSFTLSQTGMVRHWVHLLPGTRRGERRRMQRALVVNGLGAVTTAVVLGIVLFTKFTHGAWIVVIAMPVVLWLMSAIHHHYDAVTTELTPPAQGVPLPSRVRVVVAVSKLHTPTLRALAFARASRPHSIVAVTVRTSPEENDHLMAEWAERDIPVPLVVLNSPFRDLTGPLVHYVRELHRQGPRDLISVYVPEYVVGHWWEHLLHNQSALRLKARLLFLPGVMVTSVPWQLGSAEAREERRRDEPPSDVPAEAEDQEAPAPVVAR
jgi:amino acid transporter